MSAYTIQLGTIFCESGLRYYLLSLEHEFPENERDFERRKFLSKYIGIDVFGHFETYEKKRRFSYNMPFLGPDHVQVNCS